MVYYFAGKILITYISLCLIILIITGIRRKEEKLLFIPIAVLFFVYIYFLIDVTQFPLYMSKEMAADANINIWWNINLIPFKGSLYLGSLANILATIPLGFLVPLLKRKRTKKITILIVALLAGIVLEGLQLVHLLYMQFSFRVVDVNDLIFNFIGVWVGFYCFIIIRKLIMKLSQRYNTSDNRIVVYLENRA